jgi:hypothetical protein
MTKVVGLLRASVSIAMIGICAAANAPDIELDGGPLVMRRLTEDQYRNTIIDIFGHLPSAGGLSPTRAKAGLLRWAPPRPP